jgi:DNA-binding NarL/FixJ family response regulator
MKTVLVVDDHKIVLEGVTNLLKKISLVDKVISLSETKKSLQIMNSNKIDLIITDLNMPDMDGFGFVSKVRENYPEVPIIVLTMYVNYKIVSKLEPYNINMILSKDSEIDRLLDEVKILLEKDSYFKSITEVSNIKYYQNKPKSFLFDDSFNATFLLTPRELEILSLIIEGKTSLEISESLYISYGTVCCHRKNIIKKTGCKTSLEMMKIYEAMRNRISA